MNRTFQFERSYVEYPVLLNIIKSHLDKNLTILDVKFLGENIYSLIGVRLGAARAECSRPYDITIQVLKGMGEWTTGREKIERFAGEVFSIQKDRIYSVRAKTHLLFVEIVNSGY